MKSRKYIALAAAALLLTALFFGGCGGDGAEEDPVGTESPTLTIYSWADMFPETLLIRFEEETGINIVYEVFSENEEMLMRLGGGDGDYDLIIADDYIVETVINMGLAQRLDRSRLINFGNINPLFQGHFYDSADAYTVPFGAGVKTIVYDPELTGFEITGYADLWDGRLEGAVGIAGNYRVVNGMALKVMGNSYNTNSIDEIYAAGDELLRLAPNVLIINDDDLHNDLLDGRISAAVMYTDQAMMATFANPALRPALEVVYPAEGIGFGIMPGFIPANAPNADAAYLFLDFILDAQNGAEFIEHRMYYSTNSAADEYIDPEMREYLLMPAEFLDNMEMIENISDEADAAHLDVFSRFRDAVGD